MSDIDNTYKGILSQIMSNSNMEMTPDRTGVGTYRDFGVSFEIDVGKEFPLLTLRPIYWKGAAFELEWMLSGSTKISDIDLSIVHWWQPFAREEVDMLTGDISMQDDLGPIYGKKMVSASGGWDYARVIKEIKESPYSRRLLTTTWGSDIEEASLPCCHGTVVQFFVKKSQGEEKGRLNMIHFQRSCDVILGLPMNMIQYATILKLVADATGHDAGTIKWTIGDAHIYGNHIDAAETMMKREPMKLAKVNVNPKPLTGKVLLEFNADDLCVSDYVSHPQIKDLKMAV